MARLRIIILDKPDPLNARIYRYALWADVPTAQRKFYANPAIASVWIDATTADNDALKIGAVLEKVDTIQVAAGTGMAQVQVLLQDLWASYQATVTSNAAWQRYGSTWDGAAWSVTNIT